MSIADKLGIDKTKADDLRAVFAKFDADGNGTISADELTSALQTLEVTKEEIEAAYTLADSNKDGVVDYDEFVAWIYGEEPVDTTSVPIDDSWGWPKEPYDERALKKYVEEYSKYVEELKELGEKAREDRFTKKEVDPNSFKAGRWYVFMNHLGDCWLYVHNYTRDVTACRPPNYTGLTQEEKRALRKLGTLIEDLPGHLDKVHKIQKTIPLVLGSEQACEAIKTFATYDAHSRLLDTTTLRRINARALEEARKSIVHAMSNGCTLWVWLGDNNMPFFEAKVCTSKNRDTFPLGVFTYDGLLPDMVKEKIYREEDKVGGGCRVLPGFKVVLFAMFDNYMHEVSGIQLAAFQERIPNFAHMEVVKCYCEEDRKALLARMRGET